MLIKTSGIFKEMIYGLTLNEHIRIAILAMLIAQILKIFFYYLR
jgi:tetrahydromethanopterin S-methyltransferase subunit B